jgi:dolichol-phosphate mannosyltransferase
MFDPRGAERPRHQLSLIMPAFNEEAGIQTALEEAYEALAQIDCEFEIIVVDDGSTDRTSERVLEIACLRPTVILVRHLKNRGYGTALRTGFDTARHPLIAFTDADGQFHIEDIELLLNQIQNAPIAVGFRVDRKDPWLRRFLSHGYNSLVRTLLGTGVRDCDCALKVFRREVLARILPESAGFFVNAEMLCRARRQGLNIAEIGVRHRFRRHGSSKVSPWAVPETLGQLIPFWLGGMLRRLLNKRLGIGTVPSLPKLSSDFNEIGLQRPSEYVRSE